MLYVGGGPGGPVLPEVIRMAANLAVPNWAQIAISIQAGLNLTAPAVRLDNDQLLCLMDLKDRREYIIDKNTGKVTVS